jgi:AbrB family looped-hinge helix DNA binding protein
MEHVMMAENGRLVIPASLRQQIGMSKGGKLIVSIRDGLLILEPFDVAVQNFRAMSKPFVKRDSSVVDEFLAERRADESG